MVAVGLAIGEQYFTFAGLFFFFSLGILLLNNGVSVRTGDTTETTYSYDNGTLAGEYSILTFTYETSEESTFWYGFLLALCGGFGMFALLWNARQAFKKWDDIERGER